MTTRTTGLRAGWLILALATGGLLATLAGLSFAPVRVPLGLVLAWIAPGYALLLLLFPRGLSHASRFALSLPASFALAALAGVILGYVPGGLTVTAVAVTQWALAAAALSASQLLALGAVVAAPGPAATVPARTRPTPAAVAIAGVLLCGAVAWAALGIAGAVQWPPTPYTALSVTGVGSDLRVVVENAEGRHAQYAVELQVSGAPAQRWDGISLDSGSHTALLMHVDPSGGAAEVRLYRAGDTQPYRTVRLN
jgi:hypothetical protein